MKKIIVFAALMALFSFNVLAATPASKGPKIEADTKADDSQTESEGLNRLGNFGKFHFFGYGELHYNGNMGPTENEIDFHRLVFGFGYDFTDKIRYRMELDFEHAFTEPELEYAYLEFDIKKYFNVRAGGLLLPMGVYNQHHEPPTFKSVERPNFYRVIIPTSWPEAGAGFYGTFGKGFEYELYGISSLNAAHIEGGSIEGSFTGSNGLRGGRRKMAEAPGGDIAAVGRLQYTGTPGLKVGTSFFAGNTGQSELSGGMLTIFEGDAKYSFEGIDIEGAIGWTSLSDADSINTILLGTDPTFSDFVASQMFGWYAEVGYHVFHHLWPQTKHDLAVFGRFEAYDTQFKMPSGFAKNNANDRNTFTVGMSYLPIPNIAVKADYNFNWNAANADVDQFNLGLGFYY